MSVKPLLSSFTVDSILAYGRVGVDDPDGCWLWNRAFFKEGYGHLRGWRAHRAMFIVVYGDPGALLVCHGCDVPACVNPNHLWAGTQKDNIADCFAKGRASRLRGQDHPSARPEWREHMKVHYPLADPEVLARVSGSNHWSRRHPERWAQHLQDMQEARRQSHKETHVE